MSPQVTVKRTEMLVPTIDDPERKVYMIEYRSGELPPKFLYIPVKEWTKEKEAELIKADIEKRLKAPEEIIEV
ncbi:hypothetical protein ES703_85942 [subsurface metagenome]